MESGTRLRCYPNNLRTIAIPVGTSTRSTCKLHQCRDEAVRVVATADEMVGHYMVSVNDTLKALMERLNVGEWY